MSFVDLHIGSSEEEFQQLEKNSYGVGTSCPAPILAQVSMKIGELATRGTIAKQRQLSRWAGKTKRISKRRPKSIV